MSSIPPQKNMLGLGPGATGTLLFALFASVYALSATLTKRVIMRPDEKPQERPRFWRDIELPPSVK